MLPIAPEMNPSSQAWLILAGLATVAIGAAVVLRPTRRVAGPALGTYVGSPGFNEWPRMDLFPDESAFGDALERLGYDAGDWMSDGYSVLGEPVLTAVREFQRDWNLYRTKIQVPWAPQLTTDGRLGRSTIKALAGVMELVEGGLDWPNTIYDLQHGVNIS
jgi:hypothetical protein